MELTSRRLGTGGGYRVLNGDLWGNPGARQRAAEHREHTAEVRDRRIEAPIPVEVREQNGLRRGRGPQEGAC